MIKNYTIEYRTYSRHVLGYMFYINDEVVLVVNRLHDKDRCNEIIQKLKSVHSDNPDAKMIFLNSNFEHYTIN